MKEENFFIRCLIFMMLMLLSSFSACDSPSKQRRANKFIDDSLITIKEKSPLDADDFIKSFNISLETKKGNVRLNGLVDSRRIIDIVGAIVKEGNASKP